MNVDTGAKTAWQTVGTNTINLDTTFYCIIDNEYYVTGMGNIFTVLIEMYSVTSSNLKPCVLNVNEFF